MNSAQWRCTNLILFLLLLVFTIGLNLGIHGALHYSTAHGPEDITVSNTGSTGRSIPVQSKDKDIETEMVLGSNELPVSLSKLQADSHNFEPSRNQQPPSKTEFKSLQQPPSKTEFKSLNNNEIHFNSDGKIEKYVASGKKFPILLITCNRPETLKTTLNSLLSVSGVSASDILVVQDGAMVAVSDVVKSRGIKVIQNTRGINLRGGAGNDGASRIATHYKFALTTIFKENPDAPAAIVVEDDLLFSPDFMEYFLVASPILDHDNSVFALSAWNDNGFSGRVKNPYQLDRTDYFPGLGWLISRDLYTNELEQKWPRAHWDHWLRSEDTNKNREVVHPEVPRTFHNGIKGTFMDLTMHNLYFRDIAYNTDPSISWSRHQKERGKKLYMDVFTENYEVEISRLIETCHHALSVPEIVSLPGTGIFLRKLSNLINIVHGYVSFFDYLCVDRCGA